MELPALVLYIRHDFRYIKSGRQRRPFHHAFDACTPTKSAMPFWIFFISFLPSTSKFSDSFNSLYLEISSSNDFASSSFFCTFSVVSENASSAASEARFAELFVYLTANIKAAVNPRDIAAFNAV